MQSKYKFKSKNVVFTNNDMRLKSDYKSIIQDKDFASYELDSFVYQIDNEFLKGKILK